MKKQVSIFLLFLPYMIQAQYLSNLSSTRNDPIFTTYAAPLARSGYKIDQGYQFLWNDPDRGIEFISRDGPNAGIAFYLGDQTRLKLNELYHEPIVTASYSDLLTYFYYPFKNIRVEVFFSVFSSQLAVGRYHIVNEGSYPAKLTVLPYFYYPSKEVSATAEHQNIFNGFTFSLFKQRDSWMVEHQIPVVEHLQGIYLCSVPFDSIKTFPLAVDPIQPTSGKGIRSKFQNTLLKQKFQQPQLNCMIGSRSFTMAPGEKTEFRFVIGLADTVNRKADLYVKSKLLLEVDLEKLVKEDEKVYSRIPALQFHDKDQEMLYWSAFSLMRQCIMPPEGSCHFNYYVFSREPKWGWGYGGQVFHESLTMLAYAYMDPEGAMNSQRVYMERQHANGYINYRTGPYLDETILYNGMLTSSAPWYNYENLEIYKITKDKSFLQEAYKSGKEFYQYYVASRDSNQNGLCEWGAHAELESVRDARVAVWDKVGWASNFEGPDVNSMVVKEARSLSDMAKILGYLHEAEKWDSEAGKRSDLINRFLWDPSTRFYYNVNRNDQSFTYTVKDDLKIKEIIGFLPLWSHVADREKSIYLIETMKDPDEFWRPYGVPTLSAKDGYYNPIGYWNGPVWVQWDYLLFRGLLDYGYKIEAYELASRVLKNMIVHLKNDHVFWEFYSPDAYQAGWNKTYIWAGIAARFLIDMERIDNDNY